jgi:hypothetical protein
VTVEATVADASGLRRMCLSEEATSAEGCAPYVSFAAESAHTLSGGRGPKVLRAWFEDDPLPARIERTARQLSIARDELARLQAGGPGTPLIGQRFAQEEQQRRIDAVVDLTGRTILEEQARRLLIDAEWDMEAVVALVFGE